ncbi:MAG: MBL fold metallo-hydrolase [Candidatus Aerophobetes bacterium]|nr:MBL fold metallo-hydrolase [Candidatus Aerophobetes bacterium]
MKMSSYFFSLPPDFWKENPISIGSFKVYLIWFDSMGAKSSCTLIETPDLKILVDPGVAAMQPSYPLSDKEKLNLRKIALKCIKEASKKVDAIFISHYHYDHHTLLREAEEIYKGKSLWIKNPNLWINHSQWKRSRLFLKQLLGSKLEKMYTSNFSFHIEDPLNNLPLAREKNYGSYQKRREELLKKGRGRLEKLIKKWREGPWINEENLKRNRIYLADGKSFQVGDTKVKFTLPLFHGMEYDKVGWVTALVVERAKTRLIYSSDLQGPIIEDYASWIAREKPHILILDGPPTYLLGYMLNSVNLKRSIKNLIYILDEVSPQILIYDHHLLRDYRYRERVARIYEYAAKKNKKILTAAEWHKQEPLILKLTRSL